MDKQFWQNRPVLVTGGTGLVGSELVRRLVDCDADVVCLIRDWVPQSEMIRTRLIEQVRVVRGNVRNQALMERAINEFEINTVIHLAAQAIVTIANRNPVSTFETNIGGTWTVLEACHRSPTVKQIVMASSDKAYGAQETLPYNEEMPLRGRHPYDVTKSCADLIGQCYASAFGVPVVITRCGNLFGEGDLHWNRIVPGTIRSIIREQRPVIRSDGKYLRDYFYVGDAAAAYMAAAEGLARNRDLAGHAFNFTNEIPLTALELVKKILRLMDSDLEPEVRNEAMHEIRDQHLSARKAREVLGWKPVFTQEEGLRRTIAWYRAFLGEHA